MSVTVTDTQATEAAVRLAYPTMRQAAAILKVNPSTLSRRDSPFEPVGSEKRIPAWAVIDQAAYFNRRDLNEVAFDLVELAEEQGPEAVEAIEQEITEHLRAMERSAPNERPSNDWLEEARRYLPSTLYRQVEQAYAHARSGHTRRLSGPAPR